MGERLVLELGAVTDAERAELLDAVRGVLGIRGRLLEPAPPIPAPSVRGRPRDGLSDRELDVLELGLQGLTNEQMGRRLFLSVDTVKTHLRRTYAVCLDPDTGQPARGALHAVQIALRRGWLAYDPVSRRIGRPAGRRPLEPYPGVERRGAAGAARAVGERRHGV